VSCFSTSSEHRLGLALEQRCYALYMSVTFRPESSDPAPLFGGLGLLSEREMTFRTIRRIESGPPPRSIFRVLAAAWLTATETTDHVNPPRWPTFWNRLRWAWIYRTPVKGLSITDEHKRYVFSFASPEALRTALASCGAFARELFVLGSEARHRQVTRVPLEAVRDTSYEDYQKHWAPQQWDTLPEHPGQRPPKTDGHRTGWEPRAGYVLALAIFGSRSLAFAISAVPGSG